MNASIQQSRQPNPVTAFNAFLQKHKGQLELALPKHLNSDRMVRLTLTEFSKNPALQKCDVKSIFGSLITASQLGLEIGVNGQGYLIPYGKKCTFVPGWKGLVDLAQRGGRSSVWTGAVYEGDDFDYMLGDSPYCKHKPYGEFDVNKLTHVYAIGRVKDTDMPVIEVWPVKRVEAHLKKNNKVGSAHYALADGRKNFEMYARKVALLQVLKYMPQSIELSNAMEVSNAVEQGKGVTLDGDYVTIHDENEINNGQQEPITQSQDNEIINHGDQVQDNEETYIPPTFAQIKHGILSAKSPAHLEVMEEQVMDHGDKDERKQLMTLVKAQGQKFQPAAASEDVSVKKSEPQIEATTTAAVVEEKPKTEPKKARTPAAKKEVVEDDSKYQSLLKDLIDIVSKAGSIPEAKAQLRYADNNNWTDKQRKPLVDAIDKRIDELDKMSATGIAISDSCRLPETEKPLLEQIQEAPSIEVLDELLKQARRFTGEKGHIHMTAWSARKEFLNQGDIFESLDAEQDDGLTLAGRYVKRIQNAQSQEEINMIFNEPELSELIPEEQAMINAEADKREAEITG